MYLIGLSGLEFLLFARALREALRQAEALADYFDDAEGARLLTNLELATARLALTFLGVFAIGNGLALRRTTVIPSMPAWAGGLLGGVLVVTAALQPIADTTASRSEEEVHDVVTFITGIAFAGLIPLWTVATGIVGFRGEGRRTAVTGSG